MIKYLVECDRCPSLDALPYVVDLGTGALRVDVCLGCSEALGLDVLVELLDEYGVPPEATPPAKSPPRKHTASSGQWQCPQCGAVYTTRNTVLGHLQGAHGMTSPDASRLVPPIGEPAVCPTCGYVATAGTGIAVHRRLHARAS